MGVFVVSVVYVVCVGVLRWVKNVFDCEKLVVLDVVMI